jgi:acetoin utilization protein AcuB
MTTNVTRISPEDDFRKAQEILDSAPFHHLLVEQAGVLVGIVSDRDLMSKIASYIDNNPGNAFNKLQSSISVADIMTTQMLVIDRDTPIDAASILLLANNISCLPIVNADYVIEGIVTWKDLLKYYVYH